MIKSILFVLCLGLLCCSCYGQSTTLNEMRYNNLNCSGAPATQAQVGVLNQCELFGNTSTQVLSSTTIQRCYYNDTKCTEVVGECERFSVNVCYRVTGDDGNVTGTVTYLLLTGPTPPPPTSVSSSLSLSLCFAFAFASAVALVIGA